jgi:phosphoribosylanthranilate isomerase
MWIKICGTTNLEDALLAVDAGADAIGFVFAESPRRVEPEVVKRIVEELPSSVEKVGVFLNEDAERVMEVAQRAGLTGAQLQGGVTCTKPGQKLTITAVVSPSDLVALQPRPGIDRVMVDSGGARGGTGHTFDWSAAAPHLHDLRRQNLPVIIAGGLTPQNVADAIRILRPWGVDVVSGVEASPGRKDLDKVRAFIRAAREAGSEL